jgi:ELWxxDGT repeat protein
MAPPRNSLNTSAHSRAHQNRSFRPSLEPLEDRCTPTTVSLLADINTNGDSNPFFLTNVNGTLFFIATDSNNDTELWKSDGTAAGTIRVKDINPTGSSTPENLTNVNGTLFFTAADSTGDRELWKSDGTDAGTIRVKDINPTGSSLPVGLTNVNGTLFFQAEDSNNNFELWKSDGTDAGTIRVKDINPTGSSFPGNLTNVNGTLFFDATDSSGDDELWKSDGTDAGTVRVKDINTNGSSNPRNLTNVNGTLFFTATDSSGDTELWKSDGTDAGTVRVKDIDPGNGSSLPIILTNVNGTLFFSAVDGSGDRELWKSDGTDAGTVRVKDIRTNGSSLPAHLTNVNGTLFFTATDNSGDEELWKSDGTAVGTVRVKDIDTTGSSEPTNLTNVNGTLFFDAFDSTGDDELWKSDGTDAGTVRVADINPTGSSLPNVLTNVNGMLFFTANDGTHGVELYKAVDFSDDFNRADSTNLGPNWANVGGLSIVGNQLLAVGATGGTALVNNVSLVDTRVQAEVSLLTTGNSRADLFARATDANNTYVGTLVANNGVFTAKIRRVVGGISTPLAMTTVNLPIGDGVLRFEASGSLLKLFVDDTLVATATDTTFVSGKVGVSGTHLVSFDNFSANALTPDLPFGDSFERANTTLLGNQWQEPVGDMVVLNQQLVAKGTGNNIAVFNGADVANVAVQAQVNVFAPAGTGLSGGAGLVARYRDSGDYDLGLISGSNGVFTATIFHISNNTVVALVSAPVSTGTGLLRFEVVSNSLKLFLNGVLAVKTVDPTPLGSGMAGVFGTPRATFDTINIDRLFPTLFQDGFNRPDSTDIGAAYNKPSGNFAISNNQLVAQNVGINLAIRSGVVLADVKLEAQVTLSPTGASNAGLVARFQNSANYYYAALESDGNPVNPIITVSIYKLVNGVKTRIGGPVSVSGNSHKLRFEVVGNSLELFVDDTLMVSGTDSTFTMGSAGLRGSQSTTFDDFVISR